MSGLIKFVRGSLWFVWHASGPEFNGVVAGMEFDSGRIQGAIGHQKAEQLQNLDPAIHCEPYEPGIDVLSWAPNQAGAQLGYLATCGTPESARRRRK